VKRKQLLVLAALSAAAVAVLVLALRVRRAPALPPDAVHRRLADADVCMTCHGPTGSLPRSPDHPPSRECERCHVPRR
jgi:hypothetical protein